MQHSVREQVRDVANEIAEMPIEHWGQWVVYLLETLDAKVCTLDVDLWCHPVWLIDLDNTISRRILNGEW